MAINEWDDNSTPLPTLDQMRYELANKGNMPLQPNGSDVPYPVNAIPPQPVKRQVPQAEPTQTTTPSTLGNFNALGKFAIEHMPGSSLAQALAPYILATPQIAGSNLYGVGKSILNGQYGQNTDYAQQQAGQAMQATQYTPPTKAGQDISQAIGQAPEALLGSSMTPPLPELANLGRGINPDDIRVLGKQAIETGREIKNIPQDFQNAQSGVVRQNYKGQPTYGAKLQGVAEDVGDVMARRTARGESPIPGVPKGTVEVFDPRTFAVRNTNEGMFIRNRETPTGGRNDNTNYGNLDVMLRQAEPIKNEDPLHVVNAFEETVFDRNTPQSTALRDEWRVFQAKKRDELYPNMNRSDTARAFSIGYDAKNRGNIMLEWLEEFAKKAKQDGFDIPTMNEFIERNEAVKQITQKHLPNLMQKYMGTPQDPFVASAKEGITYKPASEFERFENPMRDVQETRREAGFEPMGEVANKEIPPVESKIQKLNDDIQELQNQSSEVVRTQGMGMPDPTGAIDPETGQVRQVVNPEYAKFSNQIKAKQKMLNEAEEQLRKLKVGSAYENINDLVVRPNLNAERVRYNLDPAEYQFHPELMATKKELIPFSNVPIDTGEYTVPNQAKLVDIRPEQTRYIGLEKMVNDLVNDIMHGVIPVDKVKDFSSPQAWRKWLEKKVKPRLETEAKERKAQLTYRTDVDNYFKNVLNDFPTEPVGEKGKVLWITDENMTPEQIKQNLSDITFVLDHCIGQGGRGAGTKNLFTGKERQYIAMNDPVTKRPTKNAGEDSSYVERVADGDLDIADIRDAKTGLPQITVELDRTSDGGYQMGYVSGYQNGGNKEYAPELADFLNSIKDKVDFTSNIHKHGVYDASEGNSLHTMLNDLNVERGKYPEIRKYITDTLDGDRFITLDQGKQAVAQYKQDNPPVPAVRSSPPSGREATERNIVMQNLSSMNLTPQRQLDAGEIVEDGSRFNPLAYSIGSLDPRPYSAYRSILNNQEQLGNHNNPISDYQLHRNLSDIVEQINNGHIGDYGLASRSEADELANAVQRHADAIGQLAHYADVLQRNGTRTPLASHQTHTASWQAYQEDLGNLNSEIFNDPQHLITRLSDRRNHAVPQTIMDDHPRMDRADVEEYRHLLQIHERALRQMIRHPAPAQPAQATNQIGLPIQAFSDALHGTIDRVEQNYGADTRQQVGTVVADAIAQFSRDNPNIAVNERPLRFAQQIGVASNDNNLPVEVRNSLRQVRDAITEANANHVNGQNAPALPTPTEAMPTPRDVAMEVSPVGAHQSLTQRQAQVQSLTEGINSVIRSLPDNEEGLNRSLERYQDYDNLPTIVTNNLATEDDANRVLSYIRQHIENRIDNLPENRQQVEAIRQRAYEAVSGEIRQRHGYMLEDIQNNPLTRSNLTTVIGDDLDRYGLAGSSPQAVEAVLTRIRNEGIAPTSNQNVQQGPLNAVDQSLVRLATVNYLEGDRGAFRQFGDPRDVRIGEVLIGNNTLPELAHRRIIHSLTSQTYNPATDGEALVAVINGVRGRNAFSDFTEPQKEEAFNIIRNWNALRFPNYRPPEAGMGEDPRGHKRGGAIRKRRMNEGGQPKLTPYEQFKIDNAERIRQGQEEIVNRNKYDPYKGSDKPVPTSRPSGGGAGFTPGIMNPFNPDSPLNRKKGGNVSIDEMRLALTRKK